MFVWVRWWVAVCFGGLVGGCGECCICCFFVSVKVIFTSFGMFHFTVDTLLRVGGPMVVLIVGR